MLRSLVGSEMCIRDRFGRSRFIRLGGQTFYRFRFTFHNSTGAVLLTLDDIRLYITTGVIGLATDDQLNAAVLTITNALRQITADGWVTTDRIGDGQVTEAKLAQAVRDQLGGTGLTPEQSAAIAANTAARWTGDVFVTPHELPNDTEAFTLHAFLHRVTGTFPNGARMRLEHGGRNGAFVHAADDTSAPATLAFNATQGRNSVQNIVNGLMGGNPQLRIVESDETTTIATLPIRLPIVDPASSGGSGEPIGGEILTATFEIDTTTIFTDAARLVWAGGRPPADTSASGATLFLPVVTPVGVQGIVGEVLDESNNVLSRGFMAWNDTSEDNQDGLWLYFYDFIATSGTELGQQIFQHIELIGKNVGAAPRTQSGEAHWSIVVGGGGRNLQGHKIRISYWNAIDIGIAHELIGDLAFNNPPTDLTDPEKLAVRNAIGSPTDEQIGDKAFSNPPNNLSDDEKVAVRDAIDAPVSSRVDAIEADNWVTTDRVANDAITEEKLDSEVRTKLNQSSSGGGGNPIGDIIRRTAASTENPALGNSDSTWGAGRPTGAEIVTGNLILPVSPPNDTVIGLVFEAVLASDDSVYSRAFVPWGAFGDDVNNNDVALMFYPSSSGTSSQRMHVTATRASRPTGGDAWGVYFSEATRTRTMYYGVVRLWQA